MVAQAWVSWLNQLASVGSFESSSVLSDFPRFWQVLGQALGHLMQYAGETTTALRNNQSAQLMA